MEPRVSDPGLFVGTIVRLADCLDAAGAPALLVGGLAVARHGYGRQTLDVDVLISDAHIAAVECRLRAAGFLNIERMENAVLFSAPSGGWRIDVLLTDSATFDTMRRRALPAALGGRMFAVPCLEDLLAMKIFSLRHGGARREHKDLPDIIQLIVANRSDLEKTVRPLCSRYADDAVYEKIRVGVEQCRTI